MSKLTDIKKKIDDARAKYHEIVHTATAAEVKKASDVVKAAQKELSEAICEGANACSGCSHPPHGLEQPNGRGGVEYEIGCVSGCKPVTAEDGTVRQRRVRGGLMPKHAVDAWNAGPDFWLKVKETPAPAGLS